MFSDKTNINILTSLLLKHEVMTAVVCPGSRNAPIVHNMHAAGIECHPVTDERSAGFYALGMAMAKGEPVAVCVTSGSAVLNLAPAVAEAYYQHCPLVIISADRPLERIDQLDAQTLPQQNALGRFVSMSVSLPEPTDKTSHTHCNRLVNEALIEVRRAPSIPVHINVPISEPLFNFTTERLPEERVIGFGFGLGIGSELANSSRPMIVIGKAPQPPEGGAGFGSGSEPGLKGQSQSQLPPWGDEGLGSGSKVKIDEFIRTMERQYVVLYEPLSCSFGGVPYDDVLKTIGDNTDYMPDFILYIGGIIVSKRLKNFLRNAPDAETWAIPADGKVHDTFQNLTTVIDEPIESVLAEILSSQVTPSPAAQQFKALWDKALSEVSPSPVAAFSEEAAVKMLEAAIGDGKDCHVHYANSTAVRLGCRYAKHYIHVNRGVNGIEGSLSTAAGFSLCHKEKTFCVIGDLSFFYDSNALWNTEIDGRLRILLLNNGGGAIFKTLPGLEKSEARGKYVMAEHSTSAEGICKSHNITYIEATDAESLKQGIEQLVNSESERPVILSLTPNPSPSGEGSN